MEPCIVVHGGSKTIFREDKKEAYRKGVQLAARRGYEVLLAVNFKGPFIIYGRWEWVRKWGDLKF